MVCRFLALHNLISGISKQNQIPKNRKQILPRMHFLLARGQITPTVLLQSSETFHPMFCLLCLGLSYNIAKYTGECVITPILPDSFDNVPIPGAQNEVRMRNPKEFFDFDNPKYTWIYEGTVSNMSKVLSSVFRLNIDCNFQKRASLDEIV